MGGAIFIGDELTATGFRLTGIETLTPAPDEIAPAFDAACRRAALVFITAEAALRVPGGALDAALLADHPIVAVIPDVLTRVQPASLARRIKCILGIES